MDLYDKKSKLPANCAGPVRFLENQWFTSQMLEDKTFTLLLCSKNLNVKILRE